MDAFAQLFAGLVVSLTGGSVALMVSLLCWDAVADARRMSRSYPVAAARQAKPAAAGAELGGWDTAASAA